MEHRLVIRSTCAATLNYYINHQKIYPLISQDTDPDHVDASHILALPTTYFFTFPGGSLLFWKTDDNNYEADIYFLPRKRGAVARQAAKEALSIVFSQQNPQAIKARAPQFNTKSRYFITGLGFKRVGIDPGAFLKNGVRHDVVRYEVGKEEWAALLER